LGAHGVCLSHYLDEAFTRVSAALNSCSRGQRLDPPTANWLRAQGDFAVQLLASGGAGISNEQRGRLLEFLLCLANAQDYIRKHSSAKV
jgi:hypothetical protein